MTNSISSIPTGRLSDLFIRQQLLSQLQANQAQLLRVETQLSTGHRYQLPSEDPLSALRAIGLQSLLNRKAQIQTNIKTNQSILGITDTSLCNISDLLTSIRATAIGSVDSTVTDAQRSAAVQEVEQTLEQLINIGNQQYLGRYLFAGSVSNTQPFEYTAGGIVEYSGNEQSLYSYSDISQLFATNLNGNEVFGAISSQVQGTVTITPTLTYDTQLADLRHGQGISFGSIFITDGTNSSIIDLSGAKTIGDVAKLIHDNPPTGREVYVDIGANGLIVQLDAAGGGNLSIYEVDGGAMAKELGILCENGAGTGPIVGSALHPILRDTTSLQNILGAYASAVVHSTGRDNDIRIVADTMGATTSTGVDLNDVTITLIDNGTVTAGNERVDYDPAAGTIKVYIQAGRTRAYQVINALNNAHAAGDLPFTAQIDPTDNLYNGQGLVQANATAVTRDGAGEALDQQSGLQIVNGDEEFTVDISSAQTVGDVLNAINIHSGLLAEINATKDGLNLRSRDSGADFMVGENGGATAAQLGIRSFTADTKLTDLNYGRGVPSAITQSSLDATDFTITRTDGTELDIDVYGASTIGDVLDLINNNLNNLDGKLTARLAVSGNGIELVDNSGGTGALIVANSTYSTAATDLGLLSQNNGQGAATCSTKLISIDPITLLPVPDSGIVITAKNSGIDLSGAQIVLSNTASGVTYNATTKILTVGIDPLGNTSANDVVQMINDSSYASTFNAALDPSGGNDGSGIVVDGTSGIMHAAKLTSIDPFTLSPVPNAGVIVAAADADENISGVQVLLDAAAVGVTYDVGTHTLTVGITPGATDANAVVLAINTSAYSTMFHATLDQLTANDGSGMVVDGTIGTVIGASVLDGADVNEIETTGIFTALLRLKQALQTNDISGIQRAVEILDESTQNLYTAQAKLGVLEQRLDTLNSNLDTENTQLNSLLSTEYDADMTQVVSDLAASQMAYEASLKATALIYQMSLFNYL